MKHQDDENDAKAIYNVHKKSYVMARGGNSDYKAGKQMGHMVHPKDLPSHGDTTRGLWTPPRGYRWNTMVLLS